MLAAVVVPFIFGGLMQKRQKSCTLGPIDLAKLNISEMYVM